MASEGCRQTLEPALYSAGIALYSFGVKVASLKNRKAALLVSGHKEIWDKLKAQVNPDDANIWIHAASLGEFEQGRPLIEEIKARHPEKRIILTFFSPSGYEVRKDYPLADCVCYLPFDTPGRVKRFIRLVNPEMAIFVKYEVWRNYLHELYRRSIPTYLISALFRPDQAFFKKSLAWYRYWLHWYTKIFVQTDKSRKLLERVNITNVEVAGDTRFDRVKKISDAHRSIPEVEEFVKGSELTLVAGSSWPKDEEAYFPWLQKNKNVRAIIAPHEYDSARLKSLLNAFPGETVLLSELQNGKTPEGKRILIVDCFGLLSSIYHYADVAYVGGGFGVGIHNINEAAVYGIPVVFGPNHHKFVEASDLIECGGGICIDGKSSFEKQMDMLLNDRALRRRKGEAAGKYIDSKLGATARILSSLHF